MGGKVTGADGAGSDGACKAGEPVKEWALAATFAKDGQSMKVDFSPKGGPKDVTGTWNGKDGITFPTATPGRSSRAPTSTQRPPPPRPSAPRTSARGVGASTA